MVIESFLLSGVRGNSILSELNHFFYSFFAFGLTSIVTLHPKIAQDVIADPTAIYGYRSRPGSSLSQFDIDWSNIEAVTQARTARLEYLERMKEKKKVLGKEVHQYLDAGKTMKEIAEIKVQQRNSDRIKF